MSHLIFVHGAWHGAWCWRKVLNNLPHDIQVSVIELEKNNPLDTHFNDYIEPISILIENSLKPVTLIGHSFAGFIISQMACLYPYKIQELIYLNAFIPLNNETLFSLSKQLTSNNLSPYLKINHQAKTVVLEPQEVFQKFMYNAMDSRLIPLDKITPEPLQPLNHPVQINHHFESIPKRAIISEGDLTLNKDDQIFMCNRQNIPFELIDADHCPFYSNPNLIVGILTRGKSC